MIVICSSCGFQSCGTEGCLDPRVGEASTGCPPPPTIANCARLAFSERNSGPSLLPLQTSTTVVNRWVCLYGWGGLLLNDKMETDEDNKSLFLPSLDYIAIVIWTTTLSNITSVRSSLVSFLINKQLYNANSYAVLTMIILKLRFTCQTGFPEIFTLIWSK